MSTSSLSLGELLLLSKAKERARTVSPARRARVTAYLRAADQRSRLGAIPLDTENAVAGLVLATDALPLLLRAFLASRGPDASAESENDLHALDVSAEITRIFGEENAGAAHTVEWVSAAAAFASDDPLYIDKLDDDARRRLSASLIGIGKTLRAQIDVRTVANLTGTSIGRIAALLVVVVYAVVKLSAPTNLALGKPAAQSSAWPGAAPATVLVDGNTTGARGPGNPEGSDYAHTAKDGAPWMMVDLGAPQKIRTIRIYNRNDTNFDDGLPLTLQLSNDGKTFEDVAQRTEHFGATRFDPPWTVHLDGPEARFVRVRGKDYLALSEIEVFGR